MELVSPFMASLEFDAYNDAMGIKVSKIIYCGECMMPMSCDEEGMCICPICNSKYARTRNILLQVQDNMIRRFELAQ